MLLALTMTQPTYALDWLRDFLNGFDNEDELGHMFYSSVNARTGLGEGKVYVEWATGKDDYDEAYIKPRVQAEISVQSPEDNSARGHRTWVSGIFNPVYNYDTSVDHNYVFFGVPEEGWEVDNIYSDANFNTVFTHEDQSQNGVYAAKIIVHTTATDRASQPVANLFARFNLIVTLNKYGYSTLYYSNYNFKVPSDVTATTYTFDSNNKQLLVSTTYSAGDVIPAGEAVVIKGTANTEYKFVPVNGTYTKDGDNILEGTDTETQLSGDGKFYALSAKSGVVGFYWMNSTGAAFKNGAHKAYLHLSSSAGSVKGFAFDDDDATGIQAIENKVEDGAIYNIAGQRVGKMQKGINIVNGKKIMVK